MGFLLPLEAGLRRAIRLNLDRGQFHRKIVSKEYKLSLLQFD
jgi:hypothetical protein